LPSVQVADPVDHAAVERPSAITEVTRANAIRDSLKGTNFSDPQFRRRCDALGVKIGVRRDVIQLWLIEMEQLYHFMVRQGIEDDSHTDDEWVLKHLKQFKCVCVEDVKLAYNHLARQLGLPEVLE
jgi:hypothetical protein